MADIFIGCMIEHGCDPGVAKNLAYGGLLGVVDALPLMGPRDWHSKKAAHIAPNDYDTAMSQMAEASSEMLEALPSIIPNFQGYFLFGAAHDFFRNYMGKSKHPVLNTERVVHPASIACKWWDMDQQLVAVHQACQALSAATGLDFRHSNIKNFDDVMPVSAGMKRKSEERLDAAIRREEEEVERLDAAIHRKEDEEERLDAAIRRMKKEMLVVAAAAARRKEMQEASLVAAARMKEMLVVAAAAARRKEMQEATAVAGVRRKEMLVVAAPAEIRKEMQEASLVAAARMKVMLVVAALAERRKEMQETSLVAVAAVKRMAFVINTGSKTACVRLCSHVGCVKSVHARGVCKEHGPRCSHVGCDKIPHIRGVCYDHGPRCSHVGCDKNVIARNVCKKHGITKK